MAIPADDVALQGLDDDKVMPSSMADMQDTIMGFYTENKLIAVIALLIIVVLVVMGGTMLLSTEDVTTGAMYLGLGIAALFGLYWYAGSRRTTGAGY